MDAKMLIKIIDEKIPIHVRSFGIVVLLACSSPLFFSSLPDFTSLLLMAFITLLLYFLLRLNCIFHCFVFTLAFANFVFHAEHVEKQKLPYSSAKKLIKLKAKVVDFEQYSPLKNTITVKVIDDCLEDSCVKLDGYSLSKDSLVSLSCYRCKTHYSLGDVWSFSVKLKPPRGSASWNSFDYEKYAFAKNIAAVGYLLEDESILLSVSNSFKDSLRISIRENITKLLPVEGIGFSSRSLLLALLIGDRSELTPGTWEVFSRTGLSHLMAISGLHISLVFLLASLMAYFCSASLLRVYSFVFPRKSVDACLQYCSLQNFAAVVGLLLAFFYALVSGFSLPAKRALLMLVVVCLVRVSSKKINTFDMLCCAVLGLLVMSPLNTLLVGFWLSVAAVAIISLLVLSRESKWLMQARLALAMLPFSFFIFGNFPWISPIANLIFIPLIGLLVLPVALFLLLVDFVVSSIGVGVNSNLLWKTLDGLIMKSWGILKGLLNTQDSVQLHVGSYFNKLFSIDLFANHEFINIFCAVILVICMVTWRIFLARLLIVMPLIVFFFTNTDNKLQEGEFILTTLDVGQGLALVLETQRETLIFDAGNKFLATDSATQTIIPYLKNRNIKEPDYVVISHQDSDHIGGLNTLMTEYPNTMFLGNAAVVEGYSGSDGLPEVKTCFARKWHKSGVSFQIYPQFKQALTSNNSSCVMKVSSAYGSVLLPADIERGAEHYLLEKGFDIQSTVLIAGHHGSKTSSTAAFVSRVNPELSIVSAAYFNGHGHPHKTVLNRLKKYRSKVLSTAKSGSIQIHFVKDGIEAREYRAKHPRFWYSHL